MSSQRFNNAFAQGAKRVVVTLVVCYLCGLLSLAVYLGMRSIFVQSLPQWPLWQCIVMPLAVGLFELAAETWRPSARFRAWNGDVPQWKKGVFLIVLLAGGISLVALLT
jgi:uncharacterized membrane protein YhdT